MNFDINDFYNELAWDLLCEGNTKGVFQLESNLGRKWAKEIKPRSMKELGALISLIRPGTLLAKDSNGKSMTQVYADRKAGKPDSPVEYLHESLEPILKETYGVLVYQEQSMMIAQQLAGFDLREADALRKAIGKKKADLMEEVKKKFVIGAEKTGIVTKEIAEEIFSWIEKSSRYAFNKSHAISYAFDAYWTAYCKANSPQKFYEVCLNRAERKPFPDEERKEVIMDARRFGWEVVPPRLNFMHTNFTMCENSNKIFFGLRHLKHVGTKEVEKIQELIGTTDISQYTWMDCLVKIIHELKINKRASISLISVGAFNGPNNRMNRQKMLYEFDSWKQLSAREQGAIADNQNSGDPAFYSRDLSDAVEHMMSTIKINSRRITSVKDIKDSLDKPFYNLEDRASTIAIAEEKFMSCALTCTKIDGIDIVSSTSSCKDIANGVITGKANLAVEIVNIKVITTKKGDTMAFLTVEDGTGSLDSVTVFPETFETYKDLLVEKNTILINGEMSKRDKGSIIANIIKQI